MAEHNKRFHGKRKKKRFVLPVRFSTLCRYFSSTSELKFSSEDKDENSVSSAVDKNTPGLKQARLK